MYYSKGMDTTESYQNTLDSTSTLIVMREYFNIYDNDDKLKNKIKWALKNNNERTKLLTKFNLEMKELLGLMLASFPDIFTKRMLTSLRKQLNTQIVNKKKKKIKVKASYKNDRKTINSGRCVQRVPSKNDVLQTWLLSEVCTKFRKCQG